MPFGPRELALKELPPPSNGPKGVAGNDEGRRVGGRPVATPGADLLRERLVDSFPGCVGRCRPIYELAANDARGHDQSYRHADDSPSNIRLHFAPKTAHGPVPPCERLRGPPLTERNRKREGNRDRGLMCRFRRAFGTWDSGARD